MTEKNLDALSDIAVQVSEIYAQKFNAPKTNEWVLLKLTEELGELSGAWLQYQGLGRGDADLSDVSEELADVLGFLLVFSRRAGIDPAGALLRKWGAYLPQTPSAS